MTLVWMSFCDGSRPKGSQFLGACVVDANSMEGAIRAAWSAGCNPGGEVVAFVIKPVEGLPVGRLMNKVDATAWGEKIEPADVQLPARSGALN